MVSVYIVENEKIVQDLYVMYLSRMGHEILGQSYNGIEALVDLYLNHRENPPDLIILDYTIPGKNGLDLLHDLQKLNYVKNIKVLFITGYAHLQNPALEMGVSKFVQKPFDYEMLSQSIKELAFEETAIRM